MRPRVLDPEEIKERRRAATARWRAANKDAVRANATRYHAKRREELRRLRVEAGR